MKYILAVITAMFMLTNVAHADTTQRIVLEAVVTHHYVPCLLYTSPSPRD